MSTMTIQSSVDITTARNFLRKRTAGLKWSPRMRARAAASVTAISESILEAHSVGTLAIDIHSRPDSLAIELHATFAQNTPHCIALLRERLPRITHEYSVDAQEGKQTHITVWIREEEPLNATVDTAEELESS
jgi:hypothetical protein